MHFCACGRSGKRGVIGYTRHTSSCLGVGCVTRPRVGLAPSGPLQADLSLTPVTYWSKLLGMMSLKEAHPAGQRKRCSNRSVTDLSLCCRLQATRIILGIVMPHKAALSR
jgi:hypothetical protein